MSIERSRPAPRTPAGVRSARARRLALGAILLVPAGATGCLRNPNADANVAEAITALGDELTAVRQDNADLQGQLDSLRLVVARQDTVVRRLANMAGVPVP